MAGWSVGKADAKSTLGAFHHQKKKELHYFLGWGALSKVRISCSGTNTVKVVSLFTDFFCIDFLRLELKRIRNNPISQIKITKGIARNAARLFRRGINYLTLQVTYNIFLFLEFFFKNFFGQIRFVVPKFAKYRV